MIHSRKFDNYPVKLYSNLIEWLRTISMRSAPAQQWIATIVSAKGVREEEIERSGLLQFLVEFDDAHKLTKSSC